MYLLSSLRGCFHVVEIGRVPSGVSTMTTADIAVCISYLETKMLLLVVVFFISDLAHSGKGRCLVFFISD